VQTEANAAKEISLIKQGISLLVKKETKFSLIQRFSVNIDACIRHFIFVNLFKSHKFEKIGIFLV
jgi:hypothetical protein